MQARDNVYNPETSLAGERKESGDCSWPSSVALNIVREVWWAIPSILWGTVGFKEGAQSWDMSSGRGGEKCTCTPCAGCRPSLGGKGHIIPAVCSTIWERSEVHKPESSSGVRERNRACAQHDWHSSALPWRTGVEVCSSLWGDPRLRNTQNPDCYAPAAMEAGSMHIHRKCKMVSRISVWADWQKFLPGKTSPRRLKEMATSSNAHTLKQNF